MEEENEILELNPTSSTDDQNKQDKSATPNINPKLNCSEPAESLWRYFQRPILKPKPLPNDDPKSMEMDEKILKYMCQNCEPISITERPGFEEMINFAFPRYQVKGRFYMTNLLEKNYKKHFDVLKNTLRDQILSFTTDTWSNKNGDKSFISITAHWISEEFEKEFAIAASTPLDPYEAHTGEYLKTEIEKCLAETEIPREKAHLVVRDAAAVMKKTTRLLNINSFDCFIHMMQLAIGDGLELDETGNIVKNARGIVSHFDRSNEFRKIFYETQMRMGEPKIGLIQDVTTRWNSTFYLIDRLLKCQNVLSRVAVDYKKCSSLNEIDFPKLEDLAAILAPFEKVTKSMSERNESISSVLPAYFALKAHLSSKNNLFSEMVSNGLTRRMNPFLREKFLILATLIDPRYKTRGFTEEFEKKFACSLLESELESMGLPEGERSPSPKRIRHISRNAADPIAQFLGDVGDDIDLNSESNTGSAAKLELKQYLMEQPITRDCNPMAYWKNKGIWPNLQKVARKYLSAPPSSVESERVFSTLGGIYKPKRGRLTGEHARAQLFLHHHL